MGRFIACIIFPRVNFDGLFCIGIASHLKRGCFWAPRRPRATIYHESITDAPNLSWAIKSLSVNRSHIGFAFQSGIGYHKGYCNAIGKGQPWASVRDVENRQPGGASIAARRVGLQHGGNGTRKPHQLVRVRSVGRLLTVCGRMRNSAGQPAAQGQPGQGVGNGQGGGSRVVFGACGTVGAVLHCPSNLIT